MMKLSVNVNKVAWLRNSRTGHVPSVVQASRVALDAGAMGITVHPRPDERHIRPGDVDAIHALLNEPAYADREFNIEGNPQGEAWMKIVEAIKPDQATLVPDSPDQATSDHGWTIEPNLDFLRQVIDKLQSFGCRVSLFMDPNAREIDLVPKTGADRIELYTESYAKAFEQGGDVLEKSHKQFEDAARQAHALGLGVNAGHDLNLENLPRFAAIAHVVEASIGHALIADALFMGMETTVKQYLAAIEKGVQAR